VTAVASLRAWLAADRLLRRHLRLVTAEAHPRHPTSECHVYYPMGISTNAFANDDAVQLRWMQLNKSIASISANPLHERLACRLDCRRIACPTNF